MDIGKELRIIEVEEETLEPQPPEVVALENESQPTDTGTK